MAEAAANVRPFWSGTLTFGLVSVPVELYAAVGAQRLRVHLLSPSGRPVRRRYVNAGAREALEPEAIVRGYEVSAGRFVTVSDEELADLEPQRSREIDLRRFVARDAIDPMYAERAYFLLPDGEVTKPYRLLAATMERTGQAGIATFVMRGREVAIAIYAERGILRAETLRQPDELRTAEAVGLPAAEAADAHDVAALQKAIQALAKDALDPADLGDERAAELRKLAEKKAKAGTDVFEVPEDQTAAEAEDEDVAPVVDIMAVLKQRLGVAARPATRAAAPAKRAKPAKVAAARGAKGAKAGKVAKAPRTTAAATRKPRPAKRASAA
ncbi:MAG: Ku protein [Myxococcota bacterium]